MEEREVRDLSDVVTVEVFDEKRGHGVDVVGAYGRGGVNEPGFDGGTIDRHPASADRVRKRWEVTSKTVEFLLRSPACACYLGSFFLFQMRNLRI